MKKAGVQASARTAAGPARAAAKPRRSGASSGRAAHGTRRVGAKGQPSTGAAAPAARASRVDVAYEELRRRILENVYPPGHQELEQAIADELGCSRTPVREALIRLQREGLVEVIPRHGMRVLPVSPADMAEIYAILTALESVAVEAVARRRPSDEELAPLTQATRDMERALAAERLESWAEADRRFHRHLIGLAGSRVLEETMARFLDRIHRARMVSLHLRPRPIHSTREHLRMVELLRKGDVRGAYALNRTHHDRAARELVVVFERLKLLQL